jgi:transcriptional regulator with XRE-family HTH domain
MSHGRSGSVAPMTQTRRIVDRRRLKEIREDAGLSHRQLANVMAERAQEQRGRGTSSASYLSKIESGHPDAANVSPLYLKRIADALGVDLGEFTARVPIEDAA